MRVGISRCRLRGQGGFFFAHIFKYYQLFFFARPPRHPPSQIFSSTYRVSSLSSLLSLSNSPQWPPGLAGCNFLVGPHEYHPPSASLASQVCRHKCDLLKNSCWWPQCSPLLRTLKPLGLLVQPCLPWKPFLYQEPPSLPPSPPTSSLSLSFFLSLNHTNHSCCCA